MNGIRPVFGVKSARAVSGAALLGLLSAPACDLFTGGQAKTGQDITDAGAQPDGAPQLSGNASARPATDLRPADATAQADALVPIREPRRVIAGAARLPGQHESVCSHGSGSAERWCAFFRPGSQGQSELWVFNATAALAGVPLRCDATDVNCRRLTSALWTGSAAPSGPIHPTAHRFVGDTLIFHAMGGQDGDFYQGPIFAWQPGWTAARQLSAGNRAVTCSMRPGTPVLALCLENAGSESPLQFDLTAGRIDQGDRLRTVGRIVPQRSDGRAQWGAAFSPDGERLFWSSGGTGAEADVETLHVIMASEIGTGTDKAVKLATGISRWQLSPDGRRIYYLRELDRTQDPPLGALKVAPLASPPVPLAQSETSVASQVATYFPITDDAGLDRGLMLYERAADGRIDLKLVRDDRVSTTITGVLGAWLSPDLRYVLHSGQVSPADGTSDFWISKVEGGGAPCSLTTSVRGDLYGRPFTPNGKLVFWTDHIDSALGVGEGWVGNPDGCGERRRFAAGVDFWFPADEGMVFSDEGDGKTATLKYAPITGGTTLGAPTKIFERIDRLYGVLAGFQGILFQVHKGSPAEDGLYLYGGLPFGGPR